MRAERREKNRHAVTRATFIIGIVLLAAVRTSASLAQDRVTILYDAFGKPSGVKKDWGYSALVEYGGKHILFDTGNNAEIFAQNIQASGVDLKNLDFAVMSHRHGDHTSGVNYPLTVNPQVKIFAPKEAFGIFGASLPGRTKPQVLEDFTSNSLKFQSITTDQVRVRVYKNTAVETGLSTMVGQDKGKTVPRDNRFTRVWVNQQGRWRLVANITPC